MKEVLTDRGDLPQVQVGGSPSGRPPQTPQTVCVSKSLDARGQNATRVSNQLDHLRAKDKRSWVETYSDPDPVRIRCRTENITEASEVSASVPVMQLLMSQIINNQLKEQQAALHPVHITSSVETLICQYNNQSYWSSYWFLLQAVDPDGGPEADWAEN